MQSQSLSQSKKQLDDLLNIRDKYRGLGSLMKIPVSESPAAREERKKRYLEPIRRMKQKETAQKPVM